MCEVFFRFHSGNDWNMLETQKESMLSEEIMARSEARWGRRRKVQVRTGKFFYFIQSEMGSS